MTAEKQGDNNDPTCSDTVKVSNVEKSKKGESSKEGEEDANDATAPSPGPLLRRQHSSSGSGSGNVVPAALGSIWDWIGFLFFMPKTFFVQERESF